jgi:hypothetical protein
MNNQKLYNDFVDNEKERLNKYISSSEKDLQDLTNFLSEFFSNGVSFYKSMNKKLSNLFDVNKVSDVTTKIDQNIKFFYQTSQLFISYIKVFLDKLSLTLITPLKEFKLNYEKKNIEIKKNFEKISNDFKSFKQKLITSQQKFYVKEQNYLKIKSEMNLKKLKNKFTDRDQDNLYTAKSKAMNEKEIYKYQVLSANIFYQNLDLTYKKNYKNFEINEENKFVFLNDLFGMYSNNMKDLSMYISEYCGQINSKFDGWKLDDDKKIIQDEFNCMGRYIVNNNDKKNNKGNERFNKESFKVYNNINIKYVNDYFEILENNKKGFFSINKAKIFGYIVESQDNKEDSTNYKTYDIQSNDYQKKIMKLFFDSLDSQNELTSDIISSIIELIINDKKFPQYFFKDYYVTHNTQYIRMLNEKNLEHFGNILTTIMLLTDLDNNDFLNLIANIIHFGERIYYLIPNAENKKLFLCGFLNKIPLFKCIYFWESVIRYKLVNHLEKLANEMDEKLELMDKVNKKHNHNINDYSNNNNYYDIGMNIYEELNTTDESLDINKNHKKNMKNKMKDNKTNDPNLFISIINYEANYEDLTTKLKNEYIKKAHQIFNSIILEYISSFVNYNFGLNNSLELLVKICNQFSMSNDIINYYAVYLNNCSYSVKQYSKNSFYDLKNKIDDIRVDLKYNSLKKKNEYNDLYIKLEQEKRIFNDTEKMIIIKKVSRFLPDKDKINILKLNKKFSSKLNKKIYKEILNRKDIEKGIIQNKQMHINVWKILLKYNKIKRDYPYFPNLEKVKKIKYDMNGKNDFCIIDLDSQRTLFEENNKLEQKRKILNNILKTCAMLNEEGCYCQGMNFVGAFIIKITEDEEESFYFLMGLFKYTDYRSIFKKDLSKLKLYFSIFDVVLKLYIPTLESYFEENKVKSNYYLSAWFIALFTSLVKRGKKLDAFLKIFDLFLIDGWKAIFNISMDILRKNEEILLTMKNEGLLHYLTSALGNDFVLNKENYGYLLDNNVNKRLVLRISGKLMHNIENEINQTEKIKEKLE